MKINFSENEISILKMALDNNSNQHIDNIDLLLENLDECSSKEIWNIIDRLTNLIGYDPLTDDIDALGKEADTIISKLLQFLTERGDI